MPRSRAMARKREARRAVGDQVPAAQFDDLGLDALPGVLSFTHCLSLTQPRAVLLHFRRSAWHPEMSALLSESTT